jgi:hypothetical protein
MNKNILMGVFILLVAFILTCCISTKHAVIDRALGSSMSIEYINGNGQFQVDSIIKSDTLPKFNKWLCSSFVDYETNKKTLKRMCIKRYNDGTEVMYIVTGQMEPYKISKRITK